MSQIETATTDTLRRLDPINKLAADQIDELAPQVAVERHNAGAVLFREGDADNQSVFLLKGDVNLSVGQQPPVIVSAGTEAASKPLTPNKPRLHTATCATPVEVIRIATDMLEAMIAWGQLATPEPEVVMSEDGIFMIDKGSWIKKMIKSPTFRNLPPANIEQLLDKLEPIRVRGGQVIIRQGDPGDYFYMIDQGTALVTRQTAADEDESIEMAELAEGLSFGEAALISDKPRNATVSMTTDGVLLRLSKQDFLTLLTAPNIRWVSYEEGAKLVQTNAKWLDIRPASEYAIAHIPGALNIPVQQLHRRARELDKTIQYLCYCDNGQRSSAASFILKQYGLEAYVLKDGMQTLKPEVLEKGM